MMKLVIILIVLLLVSFAT
ncbi:TPA: type I toxin-antitoxin system Ibs family toxin, partial [Escherichia coli]|nr:type I toxin-antitoxin system Ibs family toxin [Escherichia coli]